ncbi:transporter, major facilitator family protein [Dictyocaulus viviparus]|uniref:Sugar phosphate exchanger 3 n=1 Tax=Dictyocaulus viviparus TaxID=29172 RepID=A0A0D8XRE0_DICVI|nr:transporter, major facilitator family protein [Dictyocaulus viviparus]
MPRIRLRNSESVINSSLFERFVLFITGGDRWTHHHLSVFVLTFFRPPLFPSEQSASEFLALLDGGFLLAYSIGLFGGGMLGDRYNPRVVLSIGMWLSSTVVFLFGYVTEYFHFYSKPVYALLWISGGLFQSVGWPTEVSFFLNYFISLPNLFNETPRWIRRSMKSDDELVFKICIMGNWFGTSSRGAVMGLWSACASVGNIIGTIISSKLVPIGYQYAFAANSTFLFIFGFFVFINLKSAPREVGLPDPIDSPDDWLRVVEEPTQRPLPITLKRACLLPGVLSYSLAYACLKLVNYGFFFWLPFYLHSHFGWSEVDADKLSAWYDVGGIVAAIIAGSASDHFSSRTPIIVAMIICSTFALWIYSGFATSYVTNGIMLTVIGFFIGGPANMISSSVSADLGKARELRGNTEALATVTGIVDGTGSFGAALGQMFIPSVQAVFGWEAVFYGFIVMMICTAMCLVPLLYRELLLRRRETYINLSSGSEDEEDDVVVAEEDAVRRRILVGYESD